MYRVAQAADAISTILCNKTIFLFPSKSRQFTTYQPTTTCISQHKNNHFLLKHDRECHQHICRESRSMCAKGGKKQRLQGRDATRFGDLLIFPHIISLSALLHIRCEEKRSPNVSEGDCNVDIFVFFLQTCWWIGSLHTPVPTVTHRGENMQKVRSIFRCRQNVWRVKQVFQKLTIWRFSAFVHLHNFTSQQPS